MGKEWETHALAMTRVCESDRVSQGRLAWPRFVWVVPTGLESRDLSQLVGWGWKATFLASWCDPQGTLVGWRRWTTLVQMPYWFVFSFGSLSACALIMSCHVTLGPIFRLVLRCCDWLRELQFLGWRIGIEWNQSLELDALWVLRTVKVFGHSLLPVNHWTQKIFFFWLKNAKNLFYHEMWTQKHVGPIHIIINCWFWLST